MEAHISGFLNVKICDNSNFWLSKLNSKTNHRFKLFCWLKKKKHNLEVECYVLFGGQNWELKPGTQHPRKLWENALKRQELGWRTEYIGIFAAKTEHQKINVKKRKPKGVPVVTHWVKNLTSIDEDVGLIPGHIQWVKDLALPQGAA